jgi:hypothetical protein
MILFKDNIVNLVITKNNNIFIKSIIVNLNKWKNENDLNVKSEKYYNLSE